MNLSNSFRQIAKAFGLEIYKRSEWRWSHHVDGYYPVDAIPRWGHGKPEHPEILAALQTRRSAFSELLSSFCEYGALMREIPQYGNPESTKPYWRNDWFENLDAAALVGMVATKRPNRYFEIGSGNSTKFVRHTIDVMNLPTKIFSLDPQPRAAIDGLCDEIIRKGLEYSDLALFDRLEPGDILFFDGSHRMFTNSDVTVFFLEVIPRIKKGVIVHIHDIFLPADYPPDWSRKLYSEQYVLAAMMLCPRPTIQVLLPNWHVCNDPSQSGLLTSLLDPLGCKAQGWSFWIEKV